MVKSFREIRTHSTKGISMRQRLGNVFNNHFLVWRKFPIVGHSLWMKIHGGNVSINPKPEFLTVYISIFVINIPWWITCIDKERD